jgi:hypothetical protein
VELLKKNYVSLKQFSKAPESYPGLFFGINFININGYTPAMVCVFTNPGRGSFTRFHCAAYKVVREDTNHGWEKV